MGHTSPPRVRIAGLVLTLAVFGGACSWRFMQPLPEDAPPSSPPDCSTNWLAKMDGILAGAFAAASGMAFVSYVMTKDGESWMPYPKAYLYAGGAYGVPVLIFASSAITGAIWASRCDEQYVAHRKWLNEGGQPTPPADPATPAATGPATALHDGRACPEGAQASGAPPPASLAHGCVLPVEGGEPIPHGPHTNWYESGTKASEGEYHQGKRHGQWTFWYADGARKLEAHYHQGREVGHWIFWDQRGEIFKENDFDPFPQEPDQP